MPYCNVVMASRSFSCQMEQHKFLKQLIILATFCLFVSLNWQLGYRSRLQTYAQIPEEGQSFYEGSTWCSMREASIELASAGI